MCHDSPGEGGGGRAKSEGVVCHDSPVAKRKGEGRVGGGLSVITHL